MAKASAHKARTVKRDAKGRRLRVDGKPVAPQDATLRNVRAAARRTAALVARCNSLELRIEALEARLFQLDTLTERVDVLARKALGVGWGDVVDVITRPNG